MRDLFRRCPLLLLPILAACGSSGVPGVVAPVPDPAGLARGLAESTRVDRPHLVLFDWRLAEEGLRLSGRGVARVAPPYRARLDLFLQNGEAVAQAVLIEDDLRLPVTLPGGLLPPSHLLWGTLGVYRPGAGTEVLGAEDLDDGTRRIRVRLSTGEEVRYRFRDDTMLAAELLDDGSAVRQVRLEWDEHEVPAEAVYRDLPAFRELIMTRESVTYVDSFPADIWYR